MRKGNRLAVVCFEPNFVGNHHMETLCLGFQRTENCHLHCRVSQGGSREDVATGGRYYDG